PGRERSDAEAARPPLEGAPGGDGLPATGHSPARLRAEEPEAGVQARGIRNVRHAPRPGEARHHQHPFKNPHPERAGPAPHGSATPRRAGNAVQGRGSRCARPAVGGPTVRTATAGDGRRAASGTAVTGRRSARGAGDAHAVRPRGAQGGTKRAMPVRLRQEIQAVSRKAGVAATSKVPMRIQVAAGILRDNEGRVLLAERVNDLSFKGLWEFPGGKIDPSEAPEAGLCRELAEELGIAVTRLEHLASVEHDY